MTYLDTVRAAAYGAAFVRALEQFGHGTTVGEWRSVPGDAGGTEYVTRVIDARAEATRIASELAELAAESLEGA